VEATIRYRPERIGIIDEIKDLVVKFDKETIIVLIFCGILLFAWQPICEWMGWIKKPEPFAPQPPAAVTTVTKNTPDVVTNRNQAASTPTSQYIAGRKIEIPQEMESIPLQHLRNDSFDMAINPAFGEISKITFEKLLRTGSDEKLTATGIFGNNIGMLGVSADNIWRVLEILENKLDANTFTLTRRMQAGTAEFILTQTWEITSDYGIEYHIRLRNSGGENLLFNTLQISGGVLEPFAVLGHDRIRNDDYMLYYRTVEGKDHRIKIAAKDEKFFAKPEFKLQWIGLGTKYFMNVLVSETPFNTMAQARKQQNATVQEAKWLGDKTYYISNVNGIFNSIQITPGEAKVLNFKFYFGPKDKEQVNAFAPSATYISRLMSWSPMNVLADFMLWSLARLKDVCGSYGWAIILLTAIVRLLLWPVTHKANMSMKRMQLFKPEMDEIRTKYKENPQLMQVKMGELYKREGLHPLRGCLPLFMQLPIFMALYFALDGAMELRHVSFWWAADLSQPDTIFHILGTLPINPLVLMMTGLMVLQQKMMPQAGDATQQKIMMFMPLIMLFILYNLPSGLTLYWTVSQIFSILQMLLTQKIAGKNTPPTTKAAKA
jgi:YidC/Oxa1 family membrane protein insertase